jgi:hypothetical protein
LRPSGQVVLRVPVEPRGGTNCRVDFTVSPTAVPAQVTGGQSTDERVLGAHFNRFRYQPRR